MSVNVFYSAQSRYLMCSLKQESSALETVASNTHFQFTDIKRIRYAIGGFRHTDQQQGAKESCLGVKNGCSFNLTFQKSRLEKEIGFENLPEDLDNENLSNDEKLKKLAAYEKAVEGCIRDSIRFDFSNNKQIVLEKTTIKEIYKQFEQISFHLIDYAACFSDIQPTDFELYHGLGRFPQAEIPPKGIKATFSCKFPEIASLDPKTVIKTASQWNAMKTSFVEKIRIQLIQDLRKTTFQSLDPKMFQLLYKRDDS